MTIAFNAKTFRIILAVCMVLIIVGGVSGFIFARKQLQSFADSINQMETESASVDQNIENLKQLQVTLKSVEDIKAIANAVTVPAADYPVSVISNITEIASQSGVKLTSINYGDAAANTPASGAQTTTPSSPGVPATPASPTPSAPQPATPAGVTKKTISVTIQSPVSYDKFMNFIKGIEKDEMYMHITRINLSKAEGDSITVQPFTIEVYTK